MPEAIDVADGTDERPEQLAQQLNSYGWAAELLDHRWHLIWVSEELRKMYGEPEQNQTRLGEHVLLSRGQARERAVITEVSAERWLRTKWAFRA